MAEELLTSDWRDGFLFVANHLALDFLNTRPLVDGQPAELLPDLEAFSKWLAAAGLITKSASVRLARRWSTPKSAAALDQFLKLRESLRAVVFQLEANASPSPAFIKEVNRLLVQYPYLDQLVGHDDGLKRRKQFALEIPQDAFAPLADAIADLLTNADRLRLRKCQNCILHFYDTSKKGGRRWCSMNLCGNRSKVAAFAGRKRSASNDD